MRPFLYALLALPALAAAQTSTRCTTDYFGVTNCTTTATPQQDGGFWSGYNERRRQLEEQEQNQRIAAANAAATERRQAREDEEARLRLENLRLENERLRREREQPAATKPAATREDAEALLVKFRDNPSTDGDSLILISVFQGLMKEPTFSGMSRDDRISTTLVMGNDLLERDILPEAAEAFRAMAEKNAW